MSKRQELKQKREEIKRRERIYIIGGITLAVLLLAAIIILPNIKSVGEIKTVAANPRPNANKNAMGDPNAPVIVEEFSDYQCPYCAKFTEQVEAGIVSKYVATGKVYFTYKPYHLIGPESDAAAQAAYCAADQNKYWEYHDILFANQTGEEVGDFTDIRLQAFAKKLGLDMDKFNTCTSTKKYAEQVQQDTLEGQNKGITATPNFLVNGKLADMGNLADLIDQALAAK
jgi:protein-disulfide isomerase